MAYIGRTPTNAALTAADLADGIVSTAKIAADAVTDAKIADDVVGTEHLTANEVDTAALKADAVTGAQLADNAVNSEHYTDGSIDTAHIADVNVTEGKIADNAITLAKMASGTDGNIISYDASGNPVAIATGNDGQVLASTGAGSPPAFEALPVGGITGADEWRVTAHFSGDAAPITSNWERNDVHSSYIGTGMTESNGLFTFPETGLWLIQAMGAFSNNTTHSHYCGLYIRTTINNGGAFSGIASSTQGIYRGDSNNYYANAFCSALFDVTNVTNCKASLQVDHQQASSGAYGSTTDTQTGANFIRLGDT